ncbi:hypothetical protein [Paenibacillus tarimensis]|uniref:hypothetical protein n=1 Tax=Paenibacillus tarimensis TaxID=416012 RepID=UPI001F46B4A7|nr:hypothetical protein [Paenibacillus tarimensis]MCF2946299.1 hypothetical protein [Paenibacillus tarimensis]
MQPIYPLTEERVRGFCGNLVCVVMQDGTRHVGFLSTCQGGKLTLNGDAAPAVQGKPSGTRRKSSRLSSQASRTAGKKKRSGKKAGSAQTLAYPYGYGYGYGYGYPGAYPYGAAVTLDLALIALLLLVL